MQKFGGKTVVVKYGGNAMINEELKNSVMEDITLLKFIGLNPIVVHGGGPDISRALNERGGAEQIYKRSARDGRYYDTDRSAGACRKNQQGNSSAFERKRRRRGRNKR